ncbi:MAG: Fur family transcriptional regulator [Anaerotardibacter sp.]
MARNTVQQTLIEQALHELNNHPTAEEVFLHVSKDHPSIGIATVYRTLNKLCESGKARKVFSPAGADRFDYTVAPHYHVQCSKCGAIEDVLVELPQNILEQVADISNYTVDSLSLSFGGLCPKCRAEETL